jgi:hypothetical protein
MEGTGLRFRAFFPLRGIPFFFCVRNAHDLTSFTQADTALIAFLRRCGMTRIVIRGTSSVAKSRPKGWSKRLINVSA